MRRILNTTTAIVASLSLIAPQVAPAFAQGAPSQEQIILQQKQQQQKQKQQQQQRQQQQKQKAARQEQQQRQQPKPQPQQQRAQQEQPKPRQQPQHKKPAPEPQHQAQPERRQQPQREAPPQRQQQPQRQAQPQREQQPQRQAQPQREQQPQRQAQPQREQQPQRQAQPQREQQPQRQAQPQPRPTVQGGAQPQRRTSPQQVTPPPNAEELRRAMDEKRPGKPPAQRAGDQRQTPPPRTEQQRQAAQRQAEQRQAEQRRAAQRQAEQRQAEQRRRQNANARPQPQQLSAEEMRRRVQSGKGKTDLPAPEARSRPNEVMRIAASRDQAPKAAALSAAAAGNDGRDNVRERRITRENARRSDQDFRNRIEDGMRPRGGLTNEEMRRQLDRRERELRQDERRVDRRERSLDRRNDYWDDYYDRDDDDDDDDNGSDIAKLLLAGVAGFAVGRMLSGNRQVALNTGDRAVLRLPDGSQQIVRDDNALLYQPGSDVRTESFADGSTRTTVLRADGSRVVTIRDADTNILQRTLIHPNGTETRLMDNTYVRPVQLSTLPPPQPVEYSNQPWAEDDLRTALLQESAADRRFTLGQVRDIPEVRSLVAPVNVPNVTFDSGSAALNSGQAEQLATLGKVIRDSIDQNPNEVYMIEGYTDAVGSDAANLALSDRRAESVALALTEYFQVPPENMVVQGYGEQYLLIPSEGDERDNRRVAIRRITDLIEQSGT